MGKNNKIFVELRTSIMPLQDLNFPLNQIDERILQIELGLLNFLKYFKKINRNSSDFYFSDNTMDSVSKIPISIDKILEKNKVTKICRDKNKFGSRNKGAGLIEMWREIWEIIDEYKWILYFEPRTNLKSMEFLKECIDFPCNRFKILDDSDGPHFYTGFFMIETCILKEFIAGVDLNLMIEKKQSIEYLIKDFMDARYPNYSKYENKLNIIWHDVTQNRFIEF
jgi:hypothetical protein